MSATGQHAGGERRHRTRVRVEWELGDATMLAESVPHESGARAPTFELGEDGKRESGRVSLLTGSWPTPTPAPRHAAGALFTSVLVPDARVGVRTLPTLQHRGRDAPTARR